MFELTDTNPDVNVQESEYRRLLGFPSHHVLEGRTRELSEAAARQWYAEHGRPWIYARQSDGLRLTDDRIVLGGIEFVSKHLQDQLAMAQAEEAVLVAVSAGAECEAQAHQLWEAGKPDEYFFMEMYGSAVVEHLITVASGRICAWADQRGMAVLPHYSPGYTGWDVSDQNPLGALIRSRNGHGLPGALEVMDTGMLRPKKSQLAVFGITRHRDKVSTSSKLIPCENCALPACQYRRAPYKHSRPQIEEVGRLRGGTPENGNGADASPLGLTRDAKYSLNARALRKWAQERLELNLQPDGSVEARFRYEGTTCSNLGRPLEFHYRVRLAAAREDYRILEASCAPASGDAGHTFQCEYLGNAAALMGTIAHEQPLLGQPLDSVLTWQRAVNPSGCYCDADRRAHKWGLVYEVLHFALVQPDRGMVHGQPAPGMK